VPELPDVTVYVELLARKLHGERLVRARLVSFFVVRTASPRLADLEGKRALAFRRMGKRLVWEFEDDLRLVLHLMVAGRLRWRASGAKPPGRIGLAAFDFAPGTLLLTEAGTTKRASIHVVRGDDAVRALDSGGREIDAIDADEFRALVVRENHTLKRTLTDPKLLSGIGGAYADEILHRARLSPVALTQRLDEEATSRLHRACIDVLREWTDRLLAEVGDGFPEEVTAFREGMAVHGRFGEPCPECGTKVQRIVHVGRETNYCPRCQAGGKILADRALSRLLHDDWPKTVEGEDEPNGEDERARSPTK
jgi:formamidopyrimidine-DNA glycosylase